MPDNTDIREAAHTSIESLGTSGAALGHQGQLEPKRAGQPARRFKTICRQIAALALDILEQIEE
jgi:hypothetical protein